jgi:hypothetical protein
MRGCLEAGSAGSCGKWSLWRIHRMRRSRFKVQGKLDIPRALGY